MALALAAGLFSALPQARADVYLGRDGGLEGTATVDDTVQTAAQAGKWTKNNASQTIAEETSASLVRSGGKSVRMYNSTTAGRRTWTPLLTFGPITTAVTIQYYRMITNATSCQSNQVGVLRATENLQGAYNAPASINTWEKKTYSPASATFSQIAGVIMHRASTTGAGNLFVDDLCIYDGAVDTTAPSSAGAITLATNSSTALDLSWGAASGGVDGGGYLAVRYTSSPGSADDPNVNGIYATNNTVAGGVAGTVVYQGDGTSFTDSGLTTGQTYYYKIYTYDKAYNYAAEVSASGMPTGGSPSAPSVATVAASAITTNSATLNGDVTSDGGDTVTNRGVVYGTAPGLTIDSNKTAAAAGGTGTFSVALTSLPPNQTYYFRAYAQNSAGTTLGDELSFTTLTDETSAPVFGANPGPVSATAGVAVAFAVSASGNPSPVLALDSTTASGGYTFTPGTGVLDYTPPTNDVGTQTFVFQATNTVGAAMQTVSVSVASAPTTIPVVTIANIATNAFTVNWTEVTGATTYQVQIATDTNFTAGGSGTNALEEDFLTLTDTAVPAGWSTDKASDLDYTSEPYVGAAAPAYKFATTGQWLLSPAFATGATNLQFWAYGNLGAGSTFTISGLVNSVWTLVDTVAIAQNDGTYNVALDPQTTQIGFYFTRNGYNCALDDVTVQTAANDGSLVVDQSGVAALTYGATGLEMETLYYVRVRETDGTWSSLVSATTAGPEPTAPAFTGGAGPYSTTAGVAVAFTETAIGNPAPTLALDGTTASAGSYSFTANTGYFIYTPPLGDVGEQTFTFSASNSMGVAYQTVTVNVASATGPGFTSGTGPYVATSGVQWAFTVVATGAPPPALVLQSHTASSGFAFTDNDDGTGLLTYTATTNDLGTRTFTFTASNLMGVATQTLAVVVTNATPVIDSLPLRSIIVDSTLSLTVTVTDADSPLVTFASCDTTVDGATWDFNTYSGAFTFTPTTNQVGTNTFTFTAIDETYLESAPSNLVVYVSAAGSPVAVSFGQARIVGEEGGGTVLIPVNLASATTAQVEFRFIGPTNGTAQRLADFNCSTTLTISAASTGNLEIWIEDDAWAEGPESIKVQLAPVLPAYAVGTTQAVFYIRDNDAFSVVAANLTGGSTAQQYESPGERILEALCPDVVLIQEFNVTNATYRSWVDQHFGTNFSFYVEPAEDIPNGIVSRFPLTESGEWEDTYVSNRDFVYGVIDLPGDKDLHAVSLHILTTSSTVRNDEANLLITNYLTPNGWMTSSYVVVGGDFNVANRTEPAISTLGAVVKDTRQPADQAGDKETNSGRTSPYDMVLPSTNLNARHWTNSLWGYTFPNGLVFDTRPEYVTWADGLPPPALTNDSAALNMQHMGVVKVFALEQAPGLAAPQAFAATAASRTNINLTFTTNATGDGVVIVWNQTGSFTTPTGAVPAVGAAFAGGTVLYTGTNSPVNHTGLTSCATYYYRCWSVSGTNYSASGLPASAMTAGPDAPTGVWASDTNETGFAAAWSAVPGVSGYRLDVATDTNFFGGVIGETLIDADAFADFSAWDVWGVIQDTLSTHYGSPTSCVDMGSGTWLESPAVNYPTQMTFYADCSNPGTSTNYYSLDGGTSWLPISTFTVSEVGATVTNVLTNSPNLSGSTNVKFRFVSGFNTLYLDDVKVTGGSTIPPSYVAGYSNLTVSGTSQAVSDLETNTTYYFRVRAVDGACVSADSATASVTTTNLVPSPAQWTALYDRSQPLATYFLGDFLATNFEFAVGTDTNGWTAQYGAGPSPNGTGWTWAAAEWSRMDGSTGWVFKAKSGELQFTSAGSWYYAGRFATNGFTYYAAGNWTTNNTGLSAASYVTVNALNNPDGIGVVSTSSPMSEIDLVWDQNAQGHDVMVVRKPAGDSWTEPTPGATYIAGNSLGAGTVVYVGALTNVTDTGLAEGTTYDYKFYSVNNGYYSAGVLDQEATLGCAPAVPAGLYASATNAAGFTASWDAISRATNYYLDVSTNADFGGSGSPASDLFISEYVEGSSNEKYIEIFNGTGTSVDLSNYALLLYPNGTNNPTFSNTLSGALANGGVVVYRNSSATNLIGTTSSSVNYNGDDAVALWKISAAAYVDIFGSIGFDPGTAWTLGTNTTIDKTLVRKSAVTGGLTNNPATNFPTLGTEWDPYALDDESHLGSHTFTLPSPSYVAGYSNLLLGNVTSVAVTGLTEGVTYYFRVRAEGDCTSASSDTMSVVPAPTRVVLYDFTAGAENGQVVVRWRTASEENTVGFWVERWNGTEWVRVNDAFIYAQGEDGFGASYSLVDAGAVPGGEYRYRLVEIETDGGIQVYGPFDRMATALQFQSPVVLAANGVRLRWLSREGEFYKILRSTNLIAGKAGFWPIATGLPATPPENEYLDPAAGSLGMYLIQVDEEY